MCYLHTPLHWPHLTPDQYNYCEAISCSETPTTPHRESGFFYPRTSQKNIDNGQCCLRIAQSRSANGTVQQWKASECPIYLQKRETSKIQIFYSVAQQTLLLHIITHWPQAAWWCWGSWTASVEPTWRPLSSAGLGYFAHWSPAGSSGEQVDGGICNSLLYSGPEQGR